MGVLKRASCSRSNEACDFDPRRCNCMRGHISRKWRGMEIFKFGVYCSIPIVMMTYFRLPENIGHYISKYKYIEYPAEADRAQIEPETIRAVAKELKKEVNQKA